MPLGRGIVEVFEAIPERIEVSGHHPTWRVTGASFESVLAFADEAFGETVVVAREDRSRWWPRVTLTLTRDPELVATAPPPGTFADVPAPPDEPASLDEAAPDEPAPARVPTPSDGVHRAEAATDEPFASALDEIFAHQEELRLRRQRIPEQRTGRRR